MIDPVMSTGILSAEERSNLLAMQAFALKMFNRASEHLKQPADGDDRRETEHVALQSAAAYANVCQALATSAASAEASAEAQLSRQVLRPH